LAKFGLSGALPGLVDVRSFAGLSWRRIRAFGRNRYCALCGSHLRTFLPHGNPIRLHSVCPVCQSRERHRLAWLFMSECVFVDDRPCKVLHVAPEPSVAQRMRKLEQVDYVCGDIRATDGIRMDVHELPFKDQSFDFVYCSHVLNMVRDDVQALRELKRVLRTDGMALVQVPLSSGEKTIESESGWDDHDRIAAFGDPHIRRSHGKDAVTRFEQSGLRVERIDFAARHDAASFNRLGLLSEDLLICRWPEEVAR
jgi:SAM-dependent methyltransferase